MPDGKVIYERKETTMQIRLSENIRNLRKDHSMTQEQLADALGVTVGAVYKWEAGLSMPEIRLLMEMADLFDSSVDALLGYVQQSGNVGSRIKRIQEHLAEKNFDEAVTESEKALKKYPNNFRLVYTCAFMYMVKTTEDKSRKSMVKSNQLFEKAMSLLDPNTAGDVNEITIRNYIATNYMSVGDTEKALEILKHNNIRNINGSMISFLYAVELRQSDEALPYVRKTMMDYIISITRTTYGASFAYAHKHNDECISCLKWLSDFLNSLKTDPDALVYTDKFEAITLALMAVWEEMFGYSESAEKHINEAYELTARFDGSPVYDASGIRFIEGSDGMLIDSFGKTVFEAVENYVFEKVPKNKASRKIRKLWEDHEK